CIRDRNVNGVQTCALTIYLEEEQMDEIMKVMRSISYKKGEVVYREGDTSNALYVVSKGKIRIYRLSESGKEQLLRILNPGDFTRSEEHTSELQSRFDIVCR